MGAQVMTQLYDCALQNYIIYTKMMGDTVARLPMCTQLQRLRDWVANIKEPIVERRNAEGDTVARLPMRTQMQRLRDWVANIKEPIVEQRNAEGDTVARLPMRIQ